MLPPGKERGYAYLRVRINGWEVLRAVLGDKISDATMGLLVPDPDNPEGFSDEFQLDLGGPSRMDDWGPKIAEMRAKHTPWKEIWKITGLGSGPAYVAWKRFTDAQRDKSDETSDESRPEPSEDEADEQPGAA